MPTDYTQQVAAEVRAEMARQRRTRADLAKVFGYSEATASRRLNGVVAFRVDELADIAAYLGVPLTSLMTTGTAVAS